MTASWVSPNDSSIVALDSHSPARTRDEKLTRVDSSSRDEVSPVAKPPGCCSLTDSLARRKPSRAPNRLSGRTVAHSSCASNPTALERVEARRFGPRALGWRKGMIRLQERTNKLRQAIERPEVLEPPLGRVERVRSPEADVLSAGSAEPILADCAGLCEE